MLTKIEQAMGAGVYRRFLVSEGFAGIFLAILLLIETEKDAMWKVVIVLPVVLAAFAIIRMVRDTVSEGVEDMFGVIAIGATSLTPLFSGASNDVFWALAVIATLMNSLMMFDPAETLGEDIIPMSHSRWIWRLIVLSPAVPIAVAYGPTLGLKWTFAVFAIAIKVLLFKLIKWSWQQPLDRIYI